MIYLQFVNFPDIDKLKRYFCSYFQTTNKYVLMIIMKQAERILIVCKQKVAMLKYIEAGF